MDIRTTALRALPVIVLLFSVLAISSAGAQDRGPAADSALSDESPGALIDRGLALNRAQDYEGAINAWQGYLDRSGKGPDAARVRGLLREAWIHEYPLSLVYDGYARYLVKDFSGAIASWQRFTEVAPPEANTLALNDMIVRALLPEEETGNRKDR